MSDWYGGGDALSIFKDNLSDHKWYAVRTRSRCEKKIAIELKYKQLQFYLPLYKKASKSSRMIVMRDIPLFSGYLFTYVNYDNRFFIEDLNHVATLIDVPNIDSFLYELKNIEIVLQSALVVNPIDNYSVGDRVRVKKGPLEGMIGEVVRIKNKFNLIFRASIIGQAVSVEIDAQNLEAI